MEEHGNFARRIRLSPRLNAVAELAGRVDTIADIGCDHGKLCVALLQAGIARKAVATDISAPSLRKAEELAAAYGLAGRMQARLGDGLSALSPGEADAIAICGMGGELIAEMLAAAAPPLMGARLAVLQPMSGVEELREFLWREGYRILRERIAVEGKRYYQIFSIAAGAQAQPATNLAPPEGWPAGFWSLGFQAMGEPLFPGLLAGMLRRAETRLRAARGTAGEASLARRVDDLRRVRALYEGQARG